MPSVPTFACSVPSMHFTLVLPAGARRSQEETSEMAWVYNVQNYYKEFVVVGLAHLRID